MANQASTEKYQPQLLQVPPLYQWPLRLVAILRYLVIGLFYPWGYFYLAIGFPTWWFLTPDMATMATLEAGWIALLWLRNAIFLSLLAGFLHWRLHIKRSQNTDYRMNRDWLATGSDKFLWRSQVKDNMFWSIASGVTCWTAWETVTFWLYASGRVTPNYDPVYFIACLYLLFLWSTTNFYFVHRFLHWKPIYRHAHELHHRNVDVGPWTGICMHPLEAAFYFSPFILWWFVPVHPVIIILTGFYQGLNPALSHCGFDYLQITKNWRLKTGDWFHQLHHQYFNLNYGNTPTPYDKLFGSWHDGSQQSLQQQKIRMREKRRAG